jgi:hypothetical protein
LYWASFDRQREFLMKFTWDCKPNLMYATEFIRK